MEELGTVMIRSEEREKGKKNIRVRCLRVL